MALGDRPKPRPKVTASPKRVKNQIIRDALVKKEKNKKGGKDFTSTRGFKIKDRKGDKAVTNKKGEKVVVRKSGNRVVTKADGTVVRRKANGDRVISKKPTTAPKKSGKFGRRPVMVNVGSAVDFGPFDAAHPPKSAATNAVVAKDYVRMPAEKANQGESRKDYILRKYNEGLSKGGTRGR